jgi:hypothetical protein
MYETAFIGNVTELTPDGRPQATDGKVSAQ